MGTSEASPGLLITKVHGYNLVVALLFGGRRGAVNAMLATAGGARAGDKVLDVGSGPGRFAGTLAERVGPRGQVLGIDPSEPMVAYATKHVGRRDNCRFELAQAQDLDLPDASFDVVTSTFVMHHIPEEHRNTALGHMYRVLRPGGRLLIADIYPTSRVIAAVVRALTRVFTRQHPEPFADLDVRRYRDTLRDVGFTDFRFTIIKPWTGYLTATKPA